jgi:hypothetical protein
VDRPEPKKIGFIFTTKITKEKKNKIYNLRALRVLRGVIKVFCHNMHKIRNEATELYRSFSTATPRSGAVGLSGRQSTACGITESGHPVLIGTGQGGMSGNKFFQVMAAAAFASGPLIRTCNEKFTGFSAVHTQKIKKGHGYSPLFLCR